MCWDLEIDNFGHDLLQVSQLLLKSDLGVGSSTRSKSTTMHVYIEMHMYVYVYLSIYTQTVSENVRNVNIYICMYIYMSHMFPQASTGLFTKEVVILSQQSHLPVIGQPLQIQAQATSQSAINIISHQQHQASTSSAINSTRHQHHQPST